jgi:hypothetical protein
MIDIFEQLNLLLTEAEDSIKSTKKSIPIHPEMETKEQGKMAAAEKILKLFQKLQMGGDGSEMVNDGRPEIPDDMIDPMFKTPPSKSSDKTFDKNKLADWDEDIEDEDKVQKEVDSVDTPENDEFDDFDYRDNEFGDGDDDDSQEQDDDRSEGEKLKDSIKDALDSINSGDNGEQGQESDDSGSNWGDDDSGDDGDNGGSSGGSGQSQRRNARGQRLEDLKKALDSEDMDKFNSDLEDMKDIIDAPEENGSTQPGGRMETPSDEDFESDMKEAGVDSKSIEKIIKEKNTDSSKDYSDEEIEELTQQVIDGLERRNNGKSSLADTIVTTAANRKISNDDWKEILKLFLEKKSIGKGNTSISNDEIAFGNKHSLWRKAVLPKMDSPSKGQIQTINVFVDFSGSVKKNLVFHFLGEVINLCIKLKYSSVKVYGFSDNLSVPRTIDKKSLMEGTDNLDEAIKIAIGETWNFMSAQELGFAEEFRNVAEEINKIKRKEPESVFLIFGDAEWASIKNLKDYINRTRYFRDICILAYYVDKPNKTFLKTVGVIKDYVGIDHLITSKAETIR